jgi:hypothetical protein
MLASIALIQSSRRRTAGVVDQDIRLGAGLERQSVALRRRDIRRHRGHGDARGLADRRGGLFQRPGRARHDHQIDAFARQRHGTAAAKPLAGRANDRFLPLQTQVHSVPPMKSR